VKLKNWFLWSCLAVLLAGEFFIFLSNQRKDQYLVQLSEARHEVEQLRNEVSQNTNSVDTQTAEIARLRVEKEVLAQKLSRLQAEISRLNATNQEIARQLETSRAVAQQSQEQLQQWAAEGQQPQEDQAAAEPPASPSAQRAACISNLRQIDMAKQLWALEKNKPPTAVPTARDLAPFFPNGTFPVCPSGGAYTINAVNELPTCSIPGHALPQ
jgi:chromosome segregation ATPase